LKACLANGTDNSACLDGYECSAAFLTCTPGCLTDNDCLVFGEDTNDDGVFDPDDGDRFVYDTNSTAFCNTETYRCEHPGAPGAEAGIPCANDEQCEANGLCLDEEFLFYPGGYCTKIGCDLEGIDCVGDGVCQARGFPFDIPLCAEGCKVGEGVVEDDPSTLLGNIQGCRKDYTCFWDGINDDTVAINGACVPGIYNAVDVPNIGTECTENDECYSPLGQGGCDPDFGCTVFECGAPGLPANICGDAATCIDFIDFGIDLFACLKTCASAVDCLPPSEGPDMMPGDACRADLGENPVCFPFCLKSDECRDGEVCENMTQKCVP
jgi:hypothetical protein